VSDERFDIVHRVILPRLVLVADGFATGRGAMTGEEVRFVVRSAVEAGVAWVILRDHGADHDAFESAAASLIEELRAIEPSIILSLSRHLTLAHTFGAGVHTGREGPSVAEARAAIGPVHPVGYSAHAAEEAAAEGAAGADYVMVGPIYQTATHPGWPALGAGVLAEAAEAAGDVPVYAIGGVTPERVAECREAGAYGVAVLGGILDGPVGERVGAYLRALRPSEV
jgi:thiamine-phosphate pyrophosphorylase